MDIARGDVNTISVRPIIGAEAAATAAEKQAVIIKFDVRLTARP
jgi:hypothetical protein